MRSTLALWSLSAIISCIAQCILVAAPFVTPAIDTLDLDDGQLCSASVVLKTRAQFAMVDSHNLDDGCCRDFLSLVVSQLWSTLATSSMHLSLQLASR